MPISSGIRELGFLDCPGGGQVTVENGYAYIGHMNFPTGTSIVDVRDPMNPHVIAEIPVPAGIHSHKVRVSGDVMLVNYEVTDFDKAKNAHQSGGLKIFDISNRHRPREVAFWSCAGKGVHRFTFDGRFAYISPEMEGYVGNIVLILDLREPANPTEVGRWWMPGQWTAGGETPTWEGRAHRCHHPIRAGDRLYVSYWHGGLAILDISDLSKPQLVSRLDWSPPYPWPTHSGVPVPFSIGGRRWMLVADEDVHPLPGLPREMPAFLWMVDITDETNPVPVGSFQVEGLDGVEHPQMTGCHQPVEVVIGTEVPVAWFAQGLRFVDISNPHNLREAAYFVPDVPAGESRVCSNDVFMDNLGIVYLIDRVRGLSIIERK